MSQRHMPNKTLSSTPELQSEISQLRFYINHVRHAMLTAPDDYTRMLRTWVLALAEAELIRLNQMTESKAEVTKLADPSTSVAPEPLPKATAGPVKLTSPALTHPTY
jgi:hypothetical protein